MGRLCRPVVLLGGDSLCWAVGLLSAAGARYDGDLGAVDLFGLGVAVAGAVLLQVVIGSGTHVYRRRHLLGSRRDAAALAGAMATVGLVLTVLNAVGAHPVVPRTVPPMATVAAIVLAAGFRLAIRVARDVAARPDAGSASRVVVYGAGRTGEQLVRSMTEDPQSGHHPVALLDDDPDLRHQLLCGVPVAGAGTDVAEVVRSHRADLLVVALRDPDRESVRAAARAAAQIGVRVKFLPPLGERLKPSVEVADLREIDLTGLLGRCPVETDVAVVSPCLTGRRVLVTGAGGSIGSELCRQIARFDPAELLMLDRDESALHAVQLSIYGRALLDSPDVILADIRDADVVDQVFATRRPQVVFHAAALKHLPMLERHPDEAWKTNVIGTINVLESAAAQDVDTLVNISTDKAADPTSVLGRSKRIGERLVAGIAPEVEGRFLSVRFGNVLGSRGSVVTTFVEQLAMGAPVTVTHPEVSRFFMTVPESVQLVLQAAGLGFPGQVHVLDMGPRVRIVELAEQIMTKTGVWSPIVFPGLREGEKLAEDVFGADEVQRRRCHPSIVAVPVDGVAADLVALSGLHQGCSAALVHLCAVDDAPAPVEQRPGGTRSTATAVRVSTLDAPTYPLGVRR